MNIHKIAQKLEGMTIEYVQIGYDTDTLIIGLSDEGGQVYTLEIVVDSIFMEENE